MRRLMSKRKGRVLPVKRLLGASLTVCLALSMSSCGAKPLQSQSDLSAPPSQASSDTEMGGVSAKGELPIVEEKIELNVVISKNAAISDYEDNLLFNYLEEQTNIKVNLNVIPADDITQKINLMLSSGQEMPDIFLSCLPMDLISNYADKDVFIPLNNYIDSQSEYFLPLLEERPFVRNSITMPDGNILAIHDSMPAGEQTEVATHSSVSGKMWINRTWLDALNLEIPTTTEEFREVLRAFKENDPNGNGKNDEIPLIGANKGGWDSFPEIFLANAFLPYDNDNLYYIDDDGKVQACYAQDEYRDALKYVNSLVQEGFIDPVTYTQDNAQLKQLVENDVPVVGVFATAASSMVVTPGTDRFKEYVAIPPLKGPEGAQYTKTRTWSTTKKPFTAITPAYKNPEAAFKWLDYWFSDDVSIRNKYGVEGTHWKKPVEGTLANNGLPAQIEIIENLYTGDPQNIRSGNNFGYGERFMNYVVRSEDPFEQERLYMEESQKYFPYVPEEKNYMKNYFYTPEDAQAMSEVNGTLISYVDEARVKFILGTLDVNDDAVWNSYLSDIEKIGYKTVTDIMQARKDQ